MVYIYTRQFVGKFLDKFQVPAGIVLFTGREFY
jgi:hypothetical protein